MTTNKIICSILTGDKVILKERREKDEKGIIYDGGAGSGDRSGAANGNAGGG
jgi:hypothetical protein